MKKLLSVAILASLGGAGQALASTSVNINPDSIGIDPIIAVGGLDWNAGNALSVAAQGQTTSAQGNGSDPGSQVGQIFTTYAMSTLQGFNNPQGSPIGGVQLNNKLNPQIGYEWTFVAGFREQFTAVGAPAGAGTAAFGVLGGAYNPTSNFFEIWFDTTQNANNLTGKGFNDGQRILWGHFIGGQGNFTVADVNQAPLQPSGIPQIDLLDQWQADNYAGQQSVVGDGNTQGVVVVDGFDSNFFKGNLTNLTLDFTTAQKLVFEQQDPAGCFWTGSGYIGGAGNAAEGCANTIGTINGLNGTNFQLQTDATSNFNVRAVPEPGMLALLGLGFAAFGALRRKVAA